MLEMVVIFAAMNVAFEFVVLSMLPPRTRLRVLGSPNSCALLHVAFLLINLIIHWGTLIGTMSGIGAFLMSIVTVRVARAVFGYIVGDRYYTVGIKRFSVEELK